MGVATRPGVGPRGPVVALRVRALVWHDHGRNRGWYGPRMVVAHRICRGNFVERCQVDQLDTPAGEKGSGSTKSASGRSRTKVAKAALISRLVLALMTWICSPIAGSTSLNVAAVVVALTGLTSTATRVAAGTSSRRSSNRFAVSSALKTLTPVRLPPGRERLATRSSLTGSSATTKTMGIIVV